MVVAAVLAAGAAAVTHLGVFVHEPAGVAAAFPYFPR